MNDKKTYSEKVIRLCTVALESVPPMERNPKKIAQVMTQAVLYCASVQPTDPLAARINVITGCLWDHALNSQQRTDELLQQVATLVGKVNRLEERSKENEQEKRRDASKEDDSSSSSKDA